MGQVRALAVFVQPLGSALAIDGKRPPFQVTVHVIYAITYLVLRQHLANVDMM